MIETIKVDRSAISDLVIEYGQAMYEAGVRRAPNYTIDEHRDALEAANALNTRILQALYPDVDADKIRGEVKTNA